MPFESPKIEPDVMNPHYGDYYNGKKPPADYLNPVPIYFLTVKNTKFNFMIAVRENINTEDTKLGIGTLADITKKWLEKALKEHGIGAKTAVGYGYMKS